MYNQNHLHYNSDMWMLKQSQCQHIYHAPNLCTECSVPTILQVYWWSTALHTPNTSHPLRHLFLGCHVFFLMFWVFFSCLLGCLLLSANLFGFGFCFFSYGIFFWGVSQDCGCTTGCTTVITCPCKIGTTNPRPPYLTKHACSNIPT